ncbi:Txe/YoeB family addiction module toxin [Rickettsiales endosymbiont of Trichoplax sp. H2]|uniref:Txe/YoeB family addiction module toxin n=1 Tax=Rickettsiales endosymbiont of Trichoplax sp. H2 TaxID=2021221 RepID=UPI0012B2902F|nr:Txe/YoeB family addiction module toxin [Rickettsiales endosymbiont of Trichoplax sp. H2]MSO14430.1 Toxin YoeB [Rickettsiales endosymbiont of Trichoplax sp. H2]
MKIKYTRNAAEDVLYWKKKDKKIYKRLQLIIQDIRKTPLKGLGKPEVLKYNLKGKWSRRLTHEHRIVYEVFKDFIVIYQCRFHY